MLTSGYCKYLHHPENEVLALHCPEGFDLTKAQKELAKSGQLKENTEIQYSKITELEERYHHKMHVAKLNGVVLSIPGKNAGQTIIESAKEDGALAIVMGTRSRSLLQKAFQGSVSEYVLKNADIPVIIVPKKRK
ncbi:hypothetical protein NP493_957g00019 [Ridgeia piscesae]|uniref:UspA domain-containing protein n=1 Tax=Ridgeia piscesae TaxID=27915 RepID=A0AAD9NMF5_RIDPI|nr:hypothetical protein NP493_957g00019 [Ridgeia piscesae]